jgi:hypothetical protein
MTYSDIPDAVDQLRQRLEGTQQQGQPLPTHILSRLAVLVAGLDVGYIESSLVRTLPNGWTGQLVAFTKSTVYVLEADGSPALNGEPELDRTVKSTVKGTAWGRHTLQAVDLLGDDEFPWSHEWVSWPKEARIRARYANGKQLLLPVSQQPTPRVLRDFDAFYPQLLEDLAQR